MGKNDDVKRLFFAVDIPEPTRAAAERLLEETDIPPEAVRWVRPGNMHLTLKFLGETPSGKIPAIIEAAKRALTSFGPLSLTIEGMGVFPNHDRPRTIWLGVGGETGALAAMEAALSKELEGLGFPPDERPFAAHLTVGRVKSVSARGSIARLVRRLRGEFIGHAPVGEVALYESRLATAGALYTVVESFPLRKRA
ncbi:MAG: RNA 2',3'-cyclic phosphodiesterase [Candidatus Nitrospinota bacterium M3_3B_026]